MTPCIIFRYFYLRIFHSIIGNEYFDLYIYRTIYFGEYKCIGPGAASSAGRLKYQRILSDEEARPFLSMAYIQGDDWVRPPPKL